MCWKAERGISPACEGEDVPLLDTPDIRQELPHNCGSGAFHILYRYHYPKKPLPDWGDLADPVRGIGPDTLELFVRKEFANVCCGHLDLPILQVLTRTTPVICIISCGPEIDHWVCVRGVSRGFVYTQDPGDGRNRYTISEWLKIWTDSTAGGAYPRFALTGWLK